MQPSATSLDAPGLGEKATRGQPLSELRGALWIVGLGLVWALMVFWVQSLTTTPLLWKTPMVIYKNWTFRFLFDWSLAALLLARLSPGWIIAILGGNLWISAAVLSFDVNYHRALSWLTIRSQAGEGAAVFMVALRDAAPYLAALIPLSAIIAFVFSRIHPRVGRQIRLQMLAAAVWTAVFIGTHFDHKPLSDLELFESADGIAHCYGFITTWVAEAYYINLDGITQDALFQLKEPTNRLLREVAPVSIGRKLAVIQVESLDDAVRNFRIKGREVTPRLNRFAHDGNILRVQAPKKNGSCDADFALLMGAPPSARMSPYRIPNFPFELSLVEPLKKKGLHTSFYHVVTGSFFERRSAFVRMGFDKIVFREELIEKLEFKDPEWTLPDGEMFRFMGKERTHEDAFFEFSITGTSHVPFQFSLEGSPRTFFPDKSDQNYTYFDTIAYVDKVIGEYVDALPTGTVVLFYGDHWSRVDNRELGYHSEVVEDFGIVPAVLFRKTAQGIQPLFSVEDDVAQSAKLRLVDVTAWLRKSLKIPEAKDG